MTTTKQYDFLNRLLSITSGNSAIGHSYAYNLANQRIRRTEANGDYWRYQYDKLGQVTSGKKYWPDFSLLPASNSSMLLMTSEIVLKPKPAAMSTVS